MTGRLRLERKAKKPLDYKRMHAGMDEELKLDEAAAVPLPPENDSTEKMMTDDEFRQFREKIQAMSLTDSDDQTDEETKELLRKLKEVREKEKKMKARKRKEKLVEEIEERMRKLEEMEKKEMKESKKEPEVKERRSKAKGESKHTEKGKDKVKEKEKETKKKEVKGDHLLNIDTLRKDKDLRKLVNKEMKKMINLQGSDSESDSESDSSSSSSDEEEQNESSSSDLSTQSDSSDSRRRKDKKHKKNKHVKKHKMRSGIKDKPHDKVKIKMNWPQSELKYEFTNKRAVEFKNLTMSQFCAGELEIIRNCKISKAEREGRLALLNKICYYASEFDWQVLLNFYAAWVKLIEKGENKWGDDTCLLEVRMLIGKKTTNRFSKFAGNKFSSTDKFLSSGSNLDKKTWYCPLYQRNKCNVRKESHKFDIGGTERTVFHICATCLRKDGTKLSHPECSSACPHMA